MISDFLNANFLGDNIQADARIDFVLDMMREMSSQNDPNAMVRDYAKRMRQIIPSDRSMSLSRRELEAPFFRVTRSSLWETQIDPWKNLHRLPLLKGGLIGQLIYRDRPHIIEDLSQIDFSDDPAASYFEGMKSLVAIPLFDQGRALNMVIIMSEKPAAYSQESLAQHVWMSNLFGRATQNLVLADQVKKLYESVDKELRLVGEIQKSLLPTELPKIEGMDLASHYLASKRAGGDYYDFFRLPDGRWGVLIADVSGHGTPAAVLMAVTHSIAHTLGEDPSPPSKLLAFVNRHLAERYTNGSGIFVTAFYGIYDPVARELQYSCAGHPPARLFRDGKMYALNSRASLPLGIDESEKYFDAEIETLQKGDAMVFYTDGITEARNNKGEMFGEERLDIACANQQSAQTMVDSVLADLQNFCEGRPLGDDCTLLAFQITASTDPIAENI